MKFKVEFMVSYNQYPPFCVAISNYREPTSSLEQMRKGAGTYEIILDWNCPQATLQELDYG